MKDFDGYGLANMMASKKTIKAGDTVLSEGRIPTKIKDIIYSLMIRPVNIGLSPNLEADDVWLALKTLVIGGKKDATREIVRLGLKVIWVVALKR